jgi:Ca-activated chloride channel homolog
MRYFILLMLAFATMQAFQPKESITVTGSITDQEGNPIAGVSVLVKGTKMVTSTDLYGFFSITVADEKSILVFQYIGYESREIKVGRQKNISLILKTSVMALDEVVVIGYGVQRKKDITGAAITGKVAGEDISATRSHQGYNRHYPQPTLGNRQYEYNREGYDRITENSFRKVADEPLSTFSIDVDGASYSNVRRFLNNNQLPPDGAVRVEEMINYFQYGYAQPKNGDPFAIHTEMAECPWNEDHRLVMIGLQGKKASMVTLPASNLTFLIDVSGSMQSPDKLPLVKSSLRLLTDQLREEDMVSIVVYAGSAGLVLSPTSGADKNRIIAAIDQLEAGGSTAGGQGIKLAYATAKKNFMRGGNNRVILCTDGDFNVGASSDDELERMIEEERKSGVFLTILGFGTGNYQDAKMQKLADKGNGNHAYIDQLSEAKKVLVNEFGGTMFTIAKDVKLQVEFNPAYVQGYRLIGYENRMLNKEDFNNDVKDAGELGSGHTVTALYEVIPAGVATDLLNNVDPLKYQQNHQPKKIFNNEMLTVKFRYKKPDEDNSKLIVKTVNSKYVRLDNTSDQFRFAAAVAQMGMLLSHSSFIGNGNYQDVVRLAKTAIGNDQGGYRMEFLSLAEKASRLSGGLSGR